MTHAPLELVDAGPLPDVSIVVCAHGHADVTLRCLRALADAQHANLTRAEVIVVDDASADDTSARVAQVRGVRLLTLPDNVGFLRAANAGAAVATGRHVLMLNNDTEPIGRWLDPLVDLLDTRPAAMVVGSRLVFPDGTLQEAGGIVFADGSGWNYGRGMDPADPRVTFARQVDYVSGASLLVRGEFWRERGGFDERYAPAYYEDTDLCFAAREAGSSSMGAFRTLHTPGGEVWYEPASIVIHHEGTSHGTDVSVGVKAHQEANREVFAQRWAKALAGQHPNDPGVVEQARQRAARGRVVVFDNEVPTPDRDSGSVRMTAIMGTMLDLGHAVTFVPLNGWRRSPYTEQLEARGIEVLGGPEEWWGHLRAMASTITHAWLSRPHVAGELLHRVRTLLPEAAIVYDTVDLHFLRLDRQAELTGDAEVASEAARHEQLERELIDASDLAVVVSEHEAEVLAGGVRTPVVLVSNAHAGEHPAALPHGRSGLLFVGGFRHQPNVDAVRWLVAEVLPLVHREVPDAELVIVGSEPPPEVLDLAGEGVRVLGWVPDTDPLYTAARVAVAPLRFGAGVKGKVGEAMALGVPMVLTTVAAEGMGIVDGEHAAVADEAAAFAAAVVDLLGDDELWRERSAAGQALIARRLGPQATEAAVEAALAAAREAAAAARSAAAAGAS